MANKGIHLIGAKLPELRKADGKVNQTKIASMINELVSSNAITGGQASALKEAAELPTKMTIPSNVPINQAVTAPTPAPIPIEALPQKNDVSREEAQYALQRLNRLEESKPTRGQIARGAMVGSVVGPIAGLTSRAITGSKALNAPVFQGARGLAAMAGHGAVFGGLMPAISSRIERESEKSKLRKFLGQEEPKNRFRQALDSMTSNNGAQ